MAQPVTSSDARRAQMVRDQLRHRGIVDPRVLAAFAAVPREAFVPASSTARAYEDTPLAIGAGQTISQPYVVALAAQALQLHGAERVLEIGTGSGYAAAILATLAREVDTVERIPELAHAARDRLAQLGFTNVRVHHGDGTLGWPAHAPYDAIVVSAGAPRPPPALLAQLAVGGRLVLPYGELDEQELARITRREPERFDEDRLGGVRFVPLIGEAGWPEPAGQTGLDPMPVG